MVDFNVQVKPSTVHLVRFGTAVVLLAVVIGSVSEAGELPYRAAGTAYPGFADVLGYVLLRVVAALAGATALGALVYAVCCTAVTGRGRLDVDGYAGLRLAERAGLVWLLSALALIPVTAANIGGMTVSGVFRLGALGALVDASEKPKAWIVVAVLAAVVTLGARIMLSWNGAAVLLLVAAIAVLPPAMVGNAGEGPNHDYGTGAMIIFQLAVSVLPGLLWCVTEHVRRQGEHVDTAVRRGAIIGLLCVLAAALSGVVLWLILLPWSAVFNTGYGRLALLVGAAGAGLALVLRFVFARRTAPPTRRTALLIACGAALSTLALGVTVAMAVQPAPAFADRSFTAQEVFLGFDLFDPPNVARLLTLWRFDLVIGTAAVAGIVLYVIGVVRLRRRGDAWSRWRTLSWVSGCAALLIATSSGIGTYGFAMFSMHMITHMALNMFVPVLLVLGAPVTLLLRAVPAVQRGGVHGVREWVLALLHSRPTAIIAHPATALTLFVISLYGLYFTPLFESLIRYHWGHVLMNVHFLIVGYLYYWGIIGIDPGPRRLPHLGRLGVLFAVMPFHAFFGVAVMSMNTVIGSRFYTNLQLPWNIDLLADQRMGGGIAWVSGEVPVLLVVGALLTQWAAQDRRTAVRTDRKDDEYRDSDLEAYNAMLEKLAQTRR
ncbi:cytochrome c oxidase assembly protein [Nocardia brasiliensis]|uniref:cytochrome c oxidase assembly protein n=1 Tax=Nocardia brasiliensis TaxID=37326 RepID=UPI0018955D22|nr:cytochrome c oxidase assembly protein [Nocardia brasiliensis]MBF6123950.1 cytochrome c oxidase assembly protein [Nocardia brasiliensis]